MSKSAKTSHLVVAVVRDGARFKAVKVRKDEGVVQVLWTRSLPGPERTWADVAAQCDLAARPDRKNQWQPELPATVVGLDSTGVAFYRIKAPAVGGEETAAIVRMQAESLLPLPPDQIEVAWRVTPSTNGKADVTIAAARKEHLQRFATDIQSLRPENVFLSCEGVVKAWQDLFSDREPRAIVVNIGAGNTQVCLVRNGLIVQAAVLDTGLAELVPAGDGAAASGATERFAQDMRMALGAFDRDGSSPWPVFVLSDSGEASGRIAASLSAGGLPVKAVTPQAQRLRVPHGFQADDLYEFRVPLGLALLALEEGGETLNLFERISTGREREKAALARRSALVAGAVALVMLVALILTASLTDVAAEKRWTRLVAEPHLQAALKHQALLKTVARHRPDVLELLADIGAGQSDGIILDSLHFKKGQAVTITGQAGNADQMYRFQAGLLAHKGIANVEIPNSASDPKTKKIKFTMTFHYKNFSRKDSAL